ncbi:MAG TPA: PAS and helix-turn-helix domain-containing protein [Vicinamibacteria bacterium]|nr:PAS and helix-turn-helix domain-containing protein [Vicinamibacteria bacterium]
MADRRPVDTDTRGRAQDLRPAPAVVPEMRERSPELLDILAAGQPAAFASDSRDRIVFWNQGAAELFGRRSEEVLGRRCYEAIGGRDVFGNRFCYANCPVVASLRGGEGVAGFELQVSANGHGRCLTHVTILRIPSIRPDLYSVVHILSPIDPEGRLARALAASGAAPAERLPGSALAADEAAPAPPLTVREREILQWVAAGLQNKEIAQKLDLSLATVRNHIHNILEKLAVHSKLEAVSLAFRSGWVRRPDQRPAP